MPLRGSDRLSDIIREVDAGKEIPYANTPGMTNREGMQSTSTLVICPKRNPPRNAKTADRYVAVITNIRVDNTAGSGSDTYQRHTASGGA